MATICLPSMYVLTNCSSDVIKAIFHQNVYYFLSTSKRGNVVTLAEDMNAKVRQLS